MASIVATRDSDFLNMLGVNIHLEYTDGLYDNSSAAVQQDLQDLQYLGISQVRDGVPEPSGSAPQAAYESALQTLAAAKIKFDFVATPASGQSLATTISALEAVEVMRPGDITAVEGPNEINNYQITYNSLSGDSAAQAFQKDLYSAVKADPKLSGVSVYYYTGYGMVNPTPLNPALTSGYADFDNQHPYPLNGQQPAPFSSRSSLTNETPPSGPAVYTETGYTTMPGGFFNDGDATDQAKETLNVLFDDASQGISKTYLYELLDAYAPGSPQGDAGFGLFDYTGAAKLAATAIHNLTSILSDTGSVFTPASLNYSVTGLPSSGNTYLMQKSNGAFDLAVWNEPQIWNSATGTNITAPTTPVTVALGATYHTVEVFDPLYSASPIQTLSNVNSVNLGLTDHPLIVELEPQTAPTPVPTPTPTPVPTPVKILAITSVSPTTDTVGSPVTITGTGFGATQGAGTVAMGIYGMAVTSWSDTQIVATVPSQVKVGQQYDFVVTLASKTSIASGPPYLTVVGTPPAPAPTSALVLTSMQTPTPDQAQTLKPTASITVTPKDGSATIISGNKISSFNVNGDTFVLMASGVAKVYLGSTAGTIQFIGLSRVSLTESTANNVVTADGGTNTWTAGRGTLEVTGGGGADTYIYHQGDGRLTVEDFSAAKGDMLMIDTKLKASLTVVADGNGGTALLFASGGGVNLKGITTNAKDLIHWF